MMSALGVSLGSLVASPVAETRELRKARGAFFTPREVVDFLVRWAVHESHDRVLEPSCGEAEFMVAAAERLRSLGASPRLVDQLVGIELHQASAEEARRLLVIAGVESTVKTADFFAVDQLGAFDAVVGNPPYVRYQDFAGADRARAQRAAAHAGVKLSGLASSWAAFVVHASEMLTSDGRLGLVLPAELLSVNYAREVRRYLMQRFAHVELTLFDELVFPGVTAEVVLLLATGQGPTDEVLVRQVRNIADLAVPARTAHHPVDPGEKWTAALLPEPALSAFARARPLGFCDLVEWGETDLGAVTGGNKFFALAPADLGALGLSLDDVIPISPPGSRHLRGLRLDRPKWEELVHGGAKGYLFYPAVEPSPAAKRYIGDGEARKVDQAYKCRVRTPWWRVPGIQVPDLFVTCMNYDAPRIVENAANVACLNSIHGLFLREPLREAGRRLLPIAALNTVTLLGAELTGRSYGGGILKIEPREADRLPIPSPEVLEAASRGLTSIEHAVGAELAQGRLDGATELVDRVLLVDVLGVAEPDLRRMRDGRKAMFRRRAIRGATTT
jgi:adenine-specific DNA methylase